MVKTCQAANQKSKPKYFLFVAWLWRMEPTFEGWEQQCVPEGLDDVGGNSSAPFVRVGLPGEGDRVLGHLGHDRFLGRPRKLDKL